jgi:hypothetical protein
MLRYISNLAAEPTLQIFKMSKTEEEVYLTQVAKKHFAFAAALLGH